LFRLQNIHLSFGGRTLFDGLNLSFSPGEKVALCGRNGTGKSTLLKLITGELKPEQGHIENQGQKTIGLLKQELQENPDITVRNAMRGVMYEIVSLQQELKDLENALHQKNLQQDELQDLLTKTQSAHERLGYLDADKMEGKLERILSGLGFKDHDFDRTVGSFSGGWRMRLELAKLLLLNPDILLLDEPNNHLDIVALAWLEDFLSKYEGTVIVISHDQVFLDKIGKRIVELDRGKIYDYKGNYTAYKIYRESRREIEQKEYESQQKQIRHKEMLIDKFRYKASKAAFAQSLITELERMDKLEAPDEEAAEIRLKFRPVVQSGQKVLEAEHLFKSYGDKLVLEDVNLYVERGSKLSFIGANGNGKSTMVRLICNEILPTSGTLQLGHQVKVGYYAQEHSEFLHKDWTPLETLEADCTAEMRPLVRKILGSLGLRSDDVDKKIAVLSGGEKARVRLAQLLVQDHNFLILDEPTHHLDIPSKNRLKEAIKSYEGTVLVVSHDREFLKGLAQKTVLFEPRKIRVFEGDIDYCLEKTKKDQIDSEPISGENKIEIKESALDYNTRKKIQRQVQLIEKEILHMEQRIKAIEEKMHDPGFYTQPDHKVVMLEYETLKGRLESATKEWDGLIESIS